MPRKTDGLPFEVHRSPSTDDEGSVVLYATPQSDRTKEFDEIEDYLVITNALRKGELKRSFDTFLGECIKWLSQGYRVQTPIGVFSLKLGMKRRVTNPREIRHDDAVFKAIEFRPSAEFTKGVKQRVRAEGFRYVRKTDSTLLRADEEKMVKALLNSISSNGSYTTVTSFMYHSGLSKYAATKQLNYWCRKESLLLKKRKVGHSVIFELIEP